MSVPGQVVVYTKDGEAWLRVEYRPARGVVSRAGVPGTVRLAWHSVARAAAALLAVLGEAPAGALDAAAPLIVQGVRRLLARIRGLRRAGRLRGLKRLVEELAGLLEALGCRVACPGDGYGAAGPGPPAG